VSCASLTQNNYLLDYWQSSFMPLPPRSIPDLVWFISNFFKIFSDPAGFELAGLAGLAFLLGCVAFHRRHSCQELLMLLLPIVLAGLASGLHKYPFDGRLLLFIVPALMILVAEGIAFLWESSPGPGRMAAVLLAMLLVVPAVFFDVGNVIKPRPHTEIRPVVQYLNQHWRPGDTLYLYYHAVPMFEYYMDTNLFAKGDYLEGVEARTDWRKYADDLEKLRGKDRVWVLLAHIYRKAGVDEEKFFTYCLDGMGRQVDACRDANASVYLYDLRQDVNHE
ncbi:MAG: hypothetical protein V2A34_02350, partial [Lentisphaerota bacterium]